MKIAALFLSLFATTASAIELTPDNWDEATAGKTIFVKFLAPWVRWAANIARILTVVGSHLYDCLFPYR